MTPTPEELRVWGEEAEGLLRRLVDNGSDEGGFYRELAHRVSVLVGEVERLKGALERIARSGCRDHPRMCREITRRTDFWCNACFASAALSPSTDEREGGE